MTRPYRTELLRAPLRHDGFGLTLALATSYRSRAARHLSHFIVGLPARRDDPLFVSFSDAVPDRMSDDEFIACVRQLYPQTQPDCPPQRNAGHSFRRGGAPALKLAGVADSDIQRHRRWKSEVQGLFRLDSHALCLIATRALLPPWS